jgi:hypothetical protein
MMPYRKIRIFVASPGDVQSERDQLAKVGVPPAARRFHTVGSGFLGLISA